MQFINLLNSINWPTVIVGVLLVTIVNKLLFKHYLDARIENWKAERSSKSRLQSIRLTKSKLAYIEALNKDPNIIYVENQLDLARMGMMIVLALIIIASYRGHPVTPISLIPCFIFASRAWFMIRNRRNLWMNYTQESKETMARLEELRAIPQA